MGGSSGQAFPPARPEVEGPHAYSSPPEGRGGLRAAALMDWPVWGGPMAGDRLPCEAGEGGVAGGGCC